MTPAEEVREYIRSLEDYQDAVCAELERQLEAWRDVLDRMERGEELDEIILLDVDETLH